MKNGKFNTNDVKHTCENKLSIKFRNTKECNGWVIFNNVKLSRVTVPLGRKPIPPKTYKNMANQLHLTVDEFDDLLECPLTADKYFKLLRGRGVVK
ncbi:hypothetical protein KD27_02555 [Smithella sp. D17]|jgi:hypothetical protein|nr:hypothetical protein KD27_02555 [Smithella sp. D17]